MKRLIGYVGYVGYNHKLPYKYTSQFLYGAENSGLKSKLLRARSAIAPEGILALYMEIDLFTAAERSKLFLVSKCTFTAPLRALSRIKIGVCTCIRKCFKTYMCKNQKLFQRYFSRAVFDCGRDRMMAFSSARLSLRFLSNGHKRSSYSSMVNCELQKNRKSRRHTTPRRIFLRSGRAGGGDGDAQSENSYGFIQYQSAPGHDRAYVPP